MDALELLKQDHEKVKQLLERGPGSRPDAAKADFQGDQNRAGHPCSDRGEHFLSGNGGARGIEGYGA